MDLFQKIRDHIVVAAVLAGENQVDGREHGLQADIAADKKLGRTISDGVKVAGTRYILEFLEGWHHDSKADLYNLVDI